jgi:hypothetical protein
MRRKGELELGDQLSRVGLLAHAEPASAIEPRARAGIALAALGVVLGAPCAPQTAGALVAALPLGGLATCAFAVVVVVVVLLLVLLIIRLDVRAIARLLGSVVGGVRRGP